MKQLAPTEAGADALQRVRYTHDALIDIMLTNPMASPRELSELSGYSQGWISRLTCSDAFLARLAERKGEYVDPMVLDTMENRIKGLAKQALDVLEDKLSNEECGADVALRAFELTSKALGYGAKTQAQGPNINFVVALPGKSESAEDWARTFNNKGAVDVSSQG